MFVIFFKTYQEFGVRLEVCLGFRRTTSGSKQQLLVGVRRRSRAYIHFIVNRILQMTLTTVLTVRVAFVDYSAISLTARILPANAARFQMLIAILAVAPKTQHPKQQYRSRIVTQNIYVKRLAIVGICKINEMHLINNTHNNTTLKILYIFPCV